MTKIAIYSDLHLEFKDWSPPDLDVDLVILAGDISVGCRAFPWVRKTFGDTLPIVYVHGNHEPYDGSSLAGITQRLADVCKYSNIEFLQNRSVEIDGLHIAGTTLWTDFNNRDPLAMMAVQGALTDYRAISGPNGVKLLAQYVLDEHVEAMKFLTTVAGEADIIVTHHAPSEQSIHTYYKGDIINAGYYSDLEDFILYAKPKLWVHGHIHQAKRYQVGNTWVVCNPKGYPGENTGFNPALVIEVTKGNDEVRFS